MNDGSGDIHERLVQAYRLLGEAGWHAVDGRLLDTAGRPLRFDLLLQGKSLERALLPFQRNLARIGIDMRLRQVDASQYIERIRARDYDMIVSSFSQSNSPGNEQYSFWHSSSYADPGGYNRIGLKDPAIDRLVQAVVEADSRAALKPPCARPGAAMGLLPDPDLVFRRGLDRQLESLRPTAAGAALQPGAEHLVGSPRAGRAEPGGAVTWAATCCAAWR